MEQDIVIQTRGLNKFFYTPEKFRVLKDINLDILRGQFCSIVGASGSGKSTLMYLLSTLDTDYEGEIKLDGINLKSLSRNQLSSLRNQKIGFVFQFHYLLLDFTVLENIKLPALKAGKWPDEEIEDRAMKKLDMLGLRDQALKKANKLSGGQQQRAAIARALINEPEIIFGDEPSGNLDSKNTDTVLCIFKDLKKEFNQTLLVVTHDLHFAGQADRRIEFRDGEVIQDESLLSQRV